MEAWTTTDVAELLTLLGERVPIVEHLTRIVLWFFVFWLIHLGYTLAGNFTPSAREIVDR